MVFAPYVDLLDLRIQRMAVMWIAGERAVAHDKARLVRDGNT
jgi:hypothetical protein